MRKGYTPRENTGARSKNYASEGEGKQGLKAFEKDIRTAGDVGPSRNWQLVTGGE